MADNMTDHIETRHLATYPAIGLLIDGKWIHDRPACHEIVNPSTQDVLGEVPAAGAADLDRALEAAERGFAVWRATPPSRRADILRRTAQLVRDRVEQIATVITLEQGKPLGDARGEVLRAATFLEWDAEQSLRTYGRLVPTDAPLTQLVVREPIGVVAAFTPWNVPISSPSRKLSGSIAAGCSVIIKPAEETPGAACLFAQCFMDAGLPDGVLNIVFGDPAEISSRLIASPITRMVTLTGSVNVGKHLTRLAADGMKPVLMELGGHAPVLIDRDIDVAAVARLSAQAAFKMAGQICVSPSRFLIHRDVYGAFVDDFAAATRALPVGDGFTEGVFMGPVINERRLASVDALVRDAVAHGARVAAGGERIGNAGYFYAPTVLADVPHAADVMSHEPFGPLAACMQVEDMDEATTIANELPLGLAAYAFTNDADRADRLSRDIAAGSVAINVFSTPGADAPFGGYRESGMGREGGEESLDSYMVTKTVTRRLGRI